MHHLICFFDYHVSPPKPLAALVYGSIKKQINFLPLYCPGTGLKLAEVNQNLEKIERIIKKGHVVLTDYKSHIEPFNLDLESYNSYDLGLPKNPQSHDLKFIKTFLVKQLEKSVKSERPEWQQMLSKAQSVHKFLENKGFWKDDLLWHPTYDLAFTGRSITLKHNIQGASQTDNIQFPIEHDYFVHFDWISADFRVAGLLSQDEELNNTFKESDPYEYLHVALDDPQIERSDCKLQLFRSLYSLNVDGLSFYSKLSSWAAEQTSKIAEIGYSESILGRRFYLSEDRNLKSVFNAAIQGSVAHAMQAVLYKLYQKYPNYLVADIHDSIVMSCPKDILSVLIKDVSKIMANPFYGIIKENPKFPLKISIGNKWKQWEFLKRV